AELEQRKAEHDDTLRQSWQQHQAALEQSGQESVARQRLMAEKLQQQENELAARVKQIEHEIRTARELCSRQLAQDKERFSQSCATYEAELQQARALVIAQKQQLDREKREFADEVIRARQQTEQERNVIRNSLSQMDAQIRVVATSLLPGISERILSQVSETKPSDDSIAVSATTGLPEVLHDDLFCQSDVDHVSSKWEPGQDAALVDSLAGGVIRRVDSASKLGGVSGLARRPQIARRGPVAEASNAAANAEIVVDATASHPEWAGIVVTKVAEPDNDLHAEENGESRRQALEDYRSKLSVLQDQLRQLSSHAADDTAQGRTSDA
ncbi:MAG: hypothetical protein O3B13_23130, partial [Planctomycetota bacterium]|nr:hypothetical protein [Planctomycetota bacterium]